MTTRRTTTVTTKVGPAKSGGKTGATKPKRDTRFKKGISGNPRGRPQGSRNKATIALENLIAGEGEAITRAAIRLAKSRDPTALRLVMDRLIPVRKSRPSPFAAPEIKSARDGIAALGSVVDALANGELSADEASNIASVVESYRRAVETCEIEDRLQRVEAMLNAKN